ncbi:MAG: Calx-beta domain-containing protein [Solirubrobacterales bacterium]
MLKRRSAALAVLAAAAGAVFVLPAGSASAAATFDNACRNSVTANNSQIQVTMDGVGQPNPTPGGDATLSNIQQTLSVPGGIFVAGYNLGLLTAGQNTIPATVRTIIEATNTDEGTQPTPFAPSSISTTITDPDGTAGTGDESASDGTMTVAYPDQTWTPTDASGAVIEFREDTVQPLSPAVGVETGAIVIRAVIGGFLNVSFACSPATVAPPDPGTVTFIDPAPAFASTALDLSINDVTVAEGNGGQTALQFTVSLSRASLAQATVDFATADGSATAPGDYAPNSGTLTFAAGDTSEPVSLQVNGDTAVEPNETFNVNLSNATGGAAIADALGMATITNDDVAPPVTTTPPVTKKKKCKKGQKLKKGKCVKKKKKKKKK